VSSGRAAYDKATWTRLWEVSDKMVARWLQREQQQAKPTSFRYESTLLEVS